MLFRSDDLGKLESACEGVVAKVGDTLRTILDGDETKIGPQKTVNDSMEFPCGGWVGRFVLMRCRAGGSVFGEFYLE